MQSITKEAKRLIEISNEIAAFFELDNQKELMYRWHSKKDQLRAPRKLKTAIKNLEKKLKD